MMNFRERFIFNDQRSKESPLLAVCGFLCPGIERGAFPVYSGKF
jgi:hypothetical protein